MFSSIATFFCCCHLPPSFGTNVPKYEKSRGAAQHRSPASHSSTSAASCFSTSSGGCHFDISELLYFADCKLSGFSHHYFLLFLLKVVVTGTHFLYHPIFVVAQIENVFQITCIINFYSPNYAVPDICPKSPETLTYLPLCLPCY